MTFYLALIAVALRQNLATELLLLNKTAAVEILDNDIIEMEEKFQDILFQVDVLQINFVV